jgi:hypothetical protein
MKDGCRFELGESCLEVQFNRFCGLSLPAAYLRSEDGCGEFCEC